MRPLAVRSSAPFRWFGVRRLSEIAVLTQKLQELAKAPELQTKNAWKNVRGGAVSFGQRVNTSFTRMVGN